MFTLHPQTHIHTPTLFFDFTNQNAKNNLSTILLIKTTTNKENHQL